MWYKSGKAILRFRLPLLILLVVINGLMIYYASQVKLSYDFSRAVPVDNPKFKDYQNFLDKFGNDANIMVVGVSTDKYFTIKVFNAVDALQKRLRKIKYVEDVLCVPQLVNLKKDTVNETFIPEKIFHVPYTNQTDLDNDSAAFASLPFYKTLVYNPANPSRHAAYVMAINLNKEVINSARRSQLVDEIMAELNVFEKETSVSTYTSGLPYIRTVMGDRIKHEMYWFMTGSFLLSAITLLLFFRSFSAMIMSLAVVAMGVIWSFGTLKLCGYEITLLTALIPPLIVVIGIPNCIYFFNKYHTSYKEVNDQEKALINMVGKMGIVTLFCNIAAAVGFAVFAFTQSQLLKEFGVVAGINIMALFVISLLFIPSVLSYLPAPKSKHVKYLENPFLERILLGIEHWAMNHTKTIYVVTIIAVIASVVGITRLKSEGFIVDDMPKSDKIYTDLKWFETNFGGVMPLEIVVKTKKRNLLKTLQKIDDLSSYIASDSNTSRPLSFVEGLKFAKQAYYDGDTASYAVPYEGDMAFLGTYLKAKNENTHKTSLNKMLNSFLIIDSAKSNHSKDYEVKDSTKKHDNIYARISINMKDIGSKKLPVLLKNFEDKSHEIFDTAQYHITFTGSSVTFVEGSAFIINGLKDSILWAFVLIAICMLFLFRSIKILICSLIPNIVPLIITAGIMGWAGISIKPSTVLVFSVALGIVIDVTIRFLVNYKQELPHYNYDVKLTLVQTIRHTGISIIYTSVVLIAGFFIFCFSRFGGTNSLGWLTSLTLVVGTFTNLLLLPVLIKATDWGKKKK